MESTFEGPFSVPVDSEANSTLGPSYCSEAAQTIYVPIDSPPTPAPSPRPSLNFGKGQGNLLNFSNYEPAALSRREFASLASLPPSVRKRYLLSILGDCTPSELLFISTTITPLLKRDFLKELPPEIALHILSFIDDPKTLARASQVSRRWRALILDEWLWRRLCHLHEFDVDLDARSRRDDDCDNDDEPLEEMEPFAIFPMDPALQWLIARKRRARRQEKSIAFPIQISPPNLVDENMSYRKHFKTSYGTMMNWRRGGRLLRNHRVPVNEPGSVVVTSVAMDKDWVVTGLANSKINVFSAKTGVLSRTLMGHESGVWAVHLVSRGGRWVERHTACQKDEQPRGRSRRTQSESDIENVSAALAGTSLDWRRPSPFPTNRDHQIPPSSRAALGLDGRPRSLSRTRRRLPSLDRSSDDSDGGEELDKKSDVCCASEGWGQPNAVIVSGGCDKFLRVWDAKSGYCVHVLAGHTSTIRCVKVLHNCPIAVSGSRDATLRVWDVQRGRLLRVLEGHQQSVRCLDVFGNKVLSGSYDTTCRLWDVTTGECIHVLRGHYHQIYSVAYDGVRIASGGLDTMVRVWDAVTGECLALLSGHTALVCQLQLSPTILATGGSDGRVITFSLSSFKALQRIAAHDSSVTSLQFDKRFLVTGGNDGRVRLFETRTGNYVRELTEQCDCVWKVMYCKATCAIMCKRANKTVMEIWNFGARDEGDDLSA